MIIRTLKSETEQGKKVVAELLHRFTFGDSGCQDTVAEIIRHVIEKGDEAVLEYLIPAIDRALERSTTGKVHIVAHSMGGLLARALIQNDIMYAT